MSMMRSLVFLAVLLLPVLGRTAASPQPIALAVITREQSYCRADEDVIVSTLDADLRFTNPDSRQAWSLYTGDLSIRSLRIASGAAGLRSGNYLLDIRSTSILNPPADLKDLDQRKFLMIRPRETRTVKMKLSAPVSARPGQPVSGTVSAGGYVGEIIVSTWPGTSDLSTKAEPLVPVGKLWTRAVTSKPFRIVLDAPEAIRSCATSPGANTVEVQPIRRTP